MTLGKSLIKTCQFRFFRFCIIGIISNFFFFLFYLFLTNKHIDPKKAMTFVYILAAAFSYLVNKKITFLYKGDILKSGARFAIAHIFGFLLNWLILSIFVEKLKYPHHVVQGLAIFVVAAFLFAVLNFFVFQKR